MNRPGTVRATALAIRQLTDNAGLSAAQALEKPNAELVDYKTADSGVVHWALVWVPPPPVGGCRCRLWALPDPPPPPRPKRYPRSLGVISTALPPPPSGRSRWPDFCSPFR